MIRLKGLLAIFFSVDGLYRLCQERINLIERMWMMMQFFMESFVEFRCFYGWSLCWGHYRGFDYLHTMAPGALVIVLGDIDWKTWPSVRGGHGAVYQLRFRWFTHQLFKSLIYHKLRFAKYFLLPSPHSKNISTGMLERLYNFICIFGYT